MEFRLANQKDLYTLTAIYNDAIVRKTCTAHRDLQTLEERQEWFNQHQNQDYPLYVLEDKGQIAGYGYISPYRPGRTAMRFTVEVSYYLASNYQKQGLGSVMLKFLLDESLRLGYKSCLAILLSINQPSIKLLERHGFKKWGELPNIVDFDGQESSHLYYGIRISE